MKKLLLTFLIAFITALGANAKTATISSFSTKSGNIDDNISYAAKQGNGTTAPVINSNNIRLYRNSSGGKGGYLDITANNNAVISSISFSFGTQTSCILSVDGVDQASYSIPKSKTYDVNNLSATTIRIYCNTAKDKKTQLDISSITVTYTGGLGGDTPAVLGDIKYNGKAVPATISLKGGETLTFTSANAVSMTLVANGDEIHKITTLDTGEISWPAPAATEAADQTYALSITSKLNDAVKTANTTVTVAKKPTVETFELLTDLSDVNEENTYILYGTAERNPDENQHLMKTTVNKFFGTLYIKDGYFTISEDKSIIEIPPTTTGVAYITLEKTTTEGSYKLKVGEQYIKFVGEKNVALTETKADGNDFTISFDTTKNNSIRIKSGNYILAYNASNPRFTSYGVSTNFGRQHLYVKKAAQVAPEAVVATPAAENGTITVNKGTEIKFTSKNAAKLKVEFMGADAIIVDGDTYTYKADAEDILTITPIGYNGNEATDKMAEFTVVFPTPKAIVVTPAPENGTIFIQKGKTITVTSANADHLNYEIDSESGATAAGVNSWTYTADKDVTIMVTPVDQNGVIYDGKNETGHSNTDLSVIFIVDVDLSLGEITFSPAAGAVYANTEVEISCRNAESLSYTITVGEATSESVSVTGNTAKVNIAEACTVNVTANGENETSKTASAAYTIKESAGITHTLSEDKTQVTFTCENADKLVVTTYEIDGSYTEETVAANTATADCNSMYARFDVEAFQGEGETEHSLGQDRFNLLSELNATITNKGEAWYRVNSISELQENVDYIIVSHFPQANAQVKDVYMTNAFKYNSNKNKGQLGYGELNEGELIDNDAVLTLAGAEAHSDAAIFNLVSDGNGKWALKIKNVKINGAEPAVKFLTASQADDNSVNLRDEAKAEDYTSVYAGPGTADYPARMGAMRFDFEDSGSDYKYLRFNASADGQGNPQGAMFRCYSNVAGIDNVRPLYLYAKLQQAPAEVPDYTAMVMYNGGAMTQEMGKLSVEGEEMDLMCHYNKLVGHNGGEISVKIIGFDGQAKILYPKERTAQSAYNKVKPNTASGSLTMAASTHYDLAVDGATTTVPADLKDHYYEIEVQPFNWTDIAAFNIPTAIEDIDVENAEAIEEEGDARYFNLQGLEVKNPGEGIYIRVANGKATKILKK